MLLFMITIEKTGTNKIYILLGILIIYCMIVKEWSRGSKCEKKVNSKGAQRDNKKVTIRVSS